MAENAWNPRFEETLRKHLPLARDVKIGADSVLADLGLDSMELVSLLLDMEDAFGVTIPDELLVSATFATAGSLWDAVSSLAGARPS